MARLITSGFEARETVGVSGTPNVDGGDAYSGGNVAIDLTTVRSGSASVKCGNAAGGVSLVLLPSTQALATTYYVRAYFNFSQFPTIGTTSVLSNNIATAALRVTTGGVVQLWNMTAVSQVGSDGPTLSLNTWYRFELSWLHGSGSIDTLEGRVDGVSVASATGLALSDTASVGIRLGWNTNPGAGVFLYADDLALNDSTGGSQNTWPGAGNVVLLLPTADSAVGTGWTLGTGTAISSNSGSTAVKNTPPVGVADLAAGSDVKQIRNASANANVSYDGTMTTYTAAGVGAGATINVVDPITVTAAPVVTSAKQGTVGVASNPAITNIALAAGGTAGAFWSGVAGGTYATGWKVSHGTATYAPSVTLGTAPVMRVTQVTSSTRIAVVCFMGMYVDYTPAAAGGDEAAAYVGGGFYP